MTSEVFAQQLPQFSQYYHAPQIYNPSTAGFENMTIKAGYRQEWNGFEGAPKTYFIGINGNLSSLEKNKIGLRTGLSEDNKSINTYRHGISAFLMSDNYGFVKQNNIMLAFAQHYKLSQTMFFSLGMSAGVFNLGFDNKVSVTNSNDIVYRDFVNNTPSLSSLDANAGLSIYSDKFYLGYAINHLLGSKIKFSNGTPFDDYLNIAHVFTGAIKFNIQDNLFLSPFLMARTNKPMPTSMDFGLKAVYKDLLSTSISYRNNQSIIGAFGIVLNKKFVFGYSYDYSFAKSASFTSWSHEIFIAYKFYDDSSMPKRFKW